ncbi:flagellin N-terminal helical domain-containing protein [Quadrisphaera oryzae]|uniref:flagellin N-terminal helical domain-containing protein n=1 Tax=Quadrisphaera oryzae TaxID=2509661 RepID=UPI00199EBD2E|nr:hypothetical protein [Quadrisphaera sp. RL12-1S]
MTHRSLQESALARIQGNLQRIGLLQDQISSGKKITKPSDDPSGTVSSLALRQQLRLNDMYQTQADDGTSWLNAQDTALQTTSHLLTAARTDVVAALNAGFQNDGSRTATAVDIDGIRSSILALANSQYMGRNLFAGTAGGAAVTATAASVTTPPPTGSPAGTPPTYTPAVYTWSATGPTAADDSPVQRQIDAQSFVRVDTNGAQIFGTDTAANGQTAGQSVFSLLQQISDELKSPKSTGTTTDPATGTPGTCLPDLLTKLDGAISKVLTGLADVGARTNRLQRAQEVATSSKYDLTDQLSKVEDVDLPSSMIQMSLQDTAYKAALQVTSKVLNTSLMDFLR